MAASSLLLVLLAAALFSFSGAVHDTHLAGADQLPAATDGGDDTKLRVRKKLAYKKALKQHEEPICIKVFIVFTERQPAAAELPEGEAGAAIASFHHDLLSNGVLDASSNAPDRVVYHYTRSLHGFAARLTEDEKNRLAAKDGVLSIHEKVVYWPHTTRSWDFLGLPQHDDRATLPFENDVIIGMVDTGVWPHHESFSDDGLPPPPSKWKGSCHTTNNFTCNNKIIGARAYKDGNRTVSPLDSEGHGTHTASTAAGRAVAGASLDGLAGGTARGAVPGARLAIYKVCWSDGCSSADVLAAFDDAIADGVDVLSASLGTEAAFDYSADTMAVGAFHAMRHGVVTSVSAGNSGPLLGSVSNVSPWTVSSGATSVDRRIISEVVLGNGRRFEGVAITVFPDLGNPSLLVDAGGCDHEQLDGKRLKGAVLLCGPSIYVSSAAIKGTGADGAILYRAMDEEQDTAFSFAVPLVIVLKKDYGHIVDYYNSTRHAMATVMKSVTVKDAAAPKVAEFSSRGPNQITFGIIKPDLTAPGVDILAAWSPEASLSDSIIDDRRRKYNIISGTSMACPHVTGAAAYVKSAHPSWSPAAVISALVTTATPMSSGDAEAEHAYGAGQVDPVRAQDPGLVYDAGEPDFVAFLCAQGYNTSQLATMTGSSSAACASGASAVGDLNYPSIAVPVINYCVAFEAKFPRMVTNVGQADSVYRATVATVTGINITVVPDELAFSERTKKLNFTVSVSGKLLPTNSTRGASAAVVWSDGKHHVRSPIYVFPHKHVM